MNKVLYFLLVSFLPFMLHAQEYTFRVLASKGENQVMRAETKAFETLKTGTLLNENDEIILSPESYVALEHHSGKTIDIREAGITQVNILETDLLISSSNPNDDRKKYSKGLITIAAILCLVWCLIVMSKNKRYSK